MDLINSRYPIWIIRGAPGVGKSAVGRRLKKTLASSAIIEVDILRSMRASVDWADQKAQRLGIRQAVELARSFLSIGLKPVVIIDTLLGRNLDYVISILEISPLVVTLIVEDKTLIQRMNQRSLGYSNEATTLRMNSWFRLNQRTDDIVIDTTGLAADDVTKQVLYSVGERIKRQT